MTTWKVSEKNKRINLALDLVTTFILVILSIFTFLFWQIAPERIPIHFNIQGQVDGYASRHTIFFLVGVILIVYILFYFLSKHPSLGNYITHIHDSNRDIQYNIMSTFIKVISLQLILVFSYMQIQIVLVAMNNKVGFNGAILLISLGAIILSTIIYGRISLKHK